MKVNGKLLTAYDRNLTLIIAFIADAKAAVSKNNNSKQLSKPTETPIRVDFLSVYTVYMCLNFHLYVTGINQDIFWHVYCDSCGSDHKFKSSNNASE